MHIAHEHLMAAQYVECACFLKRQHVYTPDDGDHDCDDHTSTHAPYVCVAAVIVQVPTLAHGHVSESQYMAIMPSADDTRSAGKHTDRWCSEPCFDLHRYNLNCTSKDTELIVRQQRGQRHDRYPHM